MQEHKKSPETASDAPVEDTDIPEDLYPDPP